MNSDTGVFASSRSSTGRIEELWVVVGSCRR